MSTTACKTCGARIEFAKTASGALIPLDATPVLVWKPEVYGTPAKGNRTIGYQLDGNPSDSLATRDAVSMGWVQPVPDAAGPQSPVSADTVLCLVSHYTTCPDAAQHSKRGKR